MKRVLILLIAALFLVGCVTYKGGEPVKDEAYEKRQEEKKAKEEESKESEEATKEEPKEDDAHVTEHEGFSFAEHSIDEITTEIKDNELTLKFEWTNQSGIEDAPFTAIGYVDVSQDDDVLDEITDAYDPSSNNNVLRKIDNGVTMPVTLVYEIENDEPIRMLFGATHEDVTKKEEITIKDWNE